MRALTLWQPWASLVAVGAKRWETRSWRTSYRGPLLIHAARQPSWPSLAPEVDAAMAEALGSGDYGALPRGVVLAVADLVTVQPVALQWTASPRERLFGDWTLGRFVWKLEQVRPFPAPVQVAGARGLWRPSPALQAAALLLAPA